MRLPPVVAGHPTLLTMGLVATTSLPAALGRGVRAEVPSHRRVAVALGPLGEVSELALPGDLLSGPRPQSSPAGNRSREALFREFDEDVHLLRELLEHPLPRETPLGKGLPTATWLPRQPLMGLPAQLPTQRELGKSRSALGPVLVGSGALQEQRLAPPPSQAEQPPPAHSTQGQTPAAKPEPEATNTGRNVPPFDDSDVPLWGQPFLYFCGVSLVVSFCCCCLQPIDPDTLTFDVFIDLVIVVNCIFLFLDYKSERLFFYYAEQAFISIFFLEMVTRMSWEKFDWFMDPWNYFDAILVLLGVVESWAVPFLINFSSGDNGLLAFMGEHGGLVTTLRLLRLLRLCRLLRPHGTLDADEEEMDELNEVWVSLPNTEEGNNTGKRRKRGASSLKSGGPGTPA